MGSHSERSDKYVLVGVNIVQTELPANGVPAGYESVIVFLLNERPFAMHVKE
jgi:hypothetical protein